MTRFITNPGFARGEVSPEYYGREEAEFYPFAVKKMVNFWPSASGSVTPRPAVSPIKTLMGGAGNPIVDPGDLTGNFLLRTATSHGATFEDIEFIVTTHLISGGGNDYLWVVVERPTISTASLRGQVTGLVQIVEETFLLGSINLNDTILSFNRQFDYAQAGRSLFITSSIASPIRVILSAGSAAAIEQPVFYESLLGTVTPENGSTTWTGTDTLFEDQLSPGDVVRFRGDFYEIDSVTSQTEFESTTNFTGLSVTDKLELEREDIFDDIGFPRLCEFHQQRLYLAGFVESPVAIWASAAGDPFVLKASSVDDGDAINREALVQGGDSFVWMISTDRVYLGSSLGEYAIGGPSQRITPANFSIARVGTVGSLATRPETDGASIFHINAPGTQIMQVVYDFQRQAFSSLNLSTLANHLTEGGLLKTAFRGATSFDRTNRMFALTDEGQFRGNLLSVAYSEDDNILAWSQVKIPGFDGEVIDITTTPVRTYLWLRRVDSLYLCVFETIARAGLAADFVAPVAVSLGSPVTTINVPPILRAYNTLAVFRFENLPDSLTGQGDFLGDLEVDGTTLDLPEPNDGWIVMCVPFEKRLTLLDAPDGDGQGPRTNRRKRLVRCALRGRNVYQILVNDQPIRPNIGVVAGAQILPRDGWFEKRFLGWGYEAGLEIVLPSTFTGTIDTVTREVSG